MSRISKNNMKITKKNTQKVIIQDIKRCNNS